MTVEKQLEKVIDPSRIINRAESDSSAARDIQAKDLLRGEAEQLESLEKIERIADMSAARAQREQYAKQTFRVVVCWTSLVYGLLLVQAFAPSKYFHPFSDKVLIALLTTTTANFIGMFVIVLKYIFRLPEPPPVGR